MRVLVCPCGLRNTGTLLPYVGLMRFDIADLSNLEASGELADVVLHEMGHVLGYGVLWEPIPGFWNFSFLDRMPRRNPLDREQAAAFSTPDTIRWR